MLSKITDWELDKDGKETDKKRTYVVGWTLVPQNMMQGNLNNFLPVDALDGAGMRGRAGDVPPQARGVDAQVSGTCLFLLGGLREGDWCSSWCRTF